MGFSNGYDSGYADALMDVRNGRVAGLGPVSGGASGGASLPSATSTFDAGVLEGYDVEQLLSADGLDAYLATLTDAQLKGLVSTDITDSPLNGGYDMARLYLQPDNGTSCLARITYAVLQKLSDKGLVESAQ